MCVCVCVCVRKKPLTEATFVLFTLRSVSMETLREIITKINSISDQSEALVTPALRRGLRPSRQSRRVYYRWRQTRSQYAPSSDSSLSATGCKLGQTALKHYGKKVTTRQTSVWLWLRGRSWFVSVGQFISGNLKWGQCEQLSVHCHDITSCPGFLSSHFKTKMKNISVWRVLFWFISIIITMLHLCPFEPIKH